MRCFEMEMITGRTSSLGNANCQGEVDGVSNLTALDLVGVRSWDVPLSCAVQC